MKSLREVLSVLEIPAETSRQQDLLFDQVAPLNAPTPASLVFIQKPTEEAVRWISQIQAAGVLVPLEWFREHLSALVALMPLVVAVSNPRWVAARIQASVLPDDEDWYCGVHPSAIVSPNARLAPNVSIGPFSIVGDCTIGAGSRIAAFCRIHDSVRIGNEVRIRDHSAIGGVGFGAERGPNNRVQRFPHHGSVDIGDRVEIFPYVNIDRATFGVTRVGEGTFLDHYVHVGHNCFVGNACILTARVVLCGRSVVEDSVWVGVGAVIREGRRVGAGAIVGLGAIVLTDVNQGETVAGVPARRLR